MTPQRMRFGTDVLILVLAIISTTVPELVSLNRIDF